MPEKLLMSLWDFEEYCEEYIYFLNFNRHYEIDNTLPIEEFNII